MSEIIKITGNPSDRILKSLLFTLYTEYCDQNSLIKIGRTKFYEYITNNYNVKDYRQREFTGLIQYPYEDL